MDLDKKAGSPMSQDKSERGSTRGRPKGRCGRPALDYLHLQPWVASQAGESSRHRYCELGAYVISEISFRT